MSALKYILLVGPPACGKGTQAKKLSKLLGLPILGTGNLLRQAIQDGTELGNQAKEYLAKGLYVPDELIQSLVEDWCAENSDGWILDGFPRTIEQAEFIEKSPKINKPELVFGFEVPVPELEKRINSRRQCDQCDLVTSTLVHQGEICPSPECNGRLYARNDDVLDSFRVRHSQYKNLTQPVIEFYQGQGVLCKVDGTQTPDEVFTNVEQGLAKLDKDSEGELSSVG